MLQSCTIEDIPQQLALSIDYRPLTSSGAFHHGTRVTARCQEIGMYKRLGASSFLCDDGVWRPPRLPACQPTSVLTNFSQGAPPTIVHHVPTGSVQPTADGHLLVYPGSIVHLDCLLLRTRGTPVWEWSATTRRYPTGWAIAQEERNWKYRLSVYYTRTTDSGNLTCRAPDGAENVIHMVVRGVQCPTVVDVKSLRLPSTTDSRLGQTVTFTCPAGHRLVGPAAVTCLANGRWSGRLPQCQTVECPLLTLDDPHLLLTSVNLTHGSRAAFSCAPGHQLAGHRVIRCQQDGTWSGQPPICYAVTCPQPGTPRSGYAVRSGGTAVGDTVEYFCNPNHVMDGEASSFCTAGGTWSHPTPACLPICEFPGTPRGGNTNPVRFSYRVGEHVQFTCSPGHVLVGMMRATCQGDGSWSGEAPECRGYTTA
ncbi:locomotion-related protein Hikaru genki-like [Pollicipes pollicipes]|uniref:locomotion-related protein Hikaru genki-like n=1 Tax=Pollicipes pollicipes TaxID=41117 RepID=UPI001884EB71|nr:locomotion-related protein Hikaru genki-like [Pollicipes pollicipes]